MPLVNMKDMLQHAYEHHYAVGAFDLVSLDFLEGIMLAAEKTRAPVILSLAESHFEYFNFDLVMPAVEAAANRASVPVAIHLDHGASLESACHGINMGCNGVMVDASEQNFDGNVQTTYEVVKMAHACGVPVEGELGYVPGVEGEDAARHPGEVRYTTVQEARDFVDSTAVDFLAVSIGTVHGRMQGEPQLDFQRLQEINQALSMPLVIHGGTGLSDEQFTQLIENGVSKINYYTALSDAAARRILANAETERQPSYTHLQHQVQTAIAEEVERCICLWGGADRADALLQYCQAWRPVEHVIIYNVSDTSDQRVHEIMAEGRRVLSVIPGVRQVVTGEAVRDDAAYRFSWLVRFCHPAVIDSYREHPYHVAFANKLFRPVAADRISIDYRSI